jgi:hypothetical protein
MSKKEPVSKYVLPWKDNPATIEIPSTQSLVDEWGARRRAELSRPDMTQYYDASIYHGYTDTGKNKKDW